MIEQGLARHYSRLLCSEISDQSLLIPVSAPEVLIIIRDQVTARLLRTAARYWKVPHIFTDAAVEMVSMHLWHASSILFGKILQSYWFINSSTTSSSRVYIFTLWQFFPGSQETARLLILFRILDVLKMLSSEWYRSFLGFLIFSDVFASFSWSGPFLLIMISERKSPQHTRTFFDIPADFCTAVVYMVSILPRI